MQTIPVILIFDIGKTNKKLFLFNREYQIVHEETVCFEEILDEDGDACENIQAVQDWLLGSLHKLLLKTAYAIKAINYSTYGASFVHIGFDGKLVCPLYNYLKPYPPLLQQQFYSTYGGEEQLSFETASPVLGSLNSGMILYRLKHEQSALFSKIRFALHLPQFIGYLVSGKLYSDITSIGCHTNLWNFSTNNYHRWVEQEQVLQKLAPIIPSDHVDAVEVEGKKLIAGVGLHDSSAALIPYLAGFQEPFILISTGTWCISLNPFNDEPLTRHELECDCLAYLTYKGNPVKASRLFGGHEHDVQTKRIAAHFGTSQDEYKHMQFAEDIYNTFMNTKDYGRLTTDTKAILQQSLFADRDLSQFSSFKMAYHQLMMDIVTQQQASTQLVLGYTNIQHLFVDGGFSHNELYMVLLAKAFSGMQVYAASVAQATALGAALAIHHHWNEVPLPQNMVELKRY